MNGIKVQQKLTRTHRSSRVLKTPVVKLLLPVLRINIGQPPPQTSLRYLGARLMHLIKQM